MLRKRRSTGGTLDGLRLALDGLQRAKDLAELFDQLCIGAARVSGANVVGLAVDRPSGPEVVAAIGRHGAQSAEAALEAVRASGHTFADGHSDKSVHVLPLRTDLGPAIVVALRGPSDQREALSLFIAAAAPVIDLHLLRSRTAAAEHRIQPKERVASLLSSLRAGDAVTIVALDGLEELRLRSGDVAVDSVTTAVGVHLLNGTRPPGDTVAQPGDASYLVVLRDLKAPVEVIIHRLLTAWNATLPSTSISIGAALHLDGLSPIQTQEEAERALESARRLGGGRAHVAASSVQPR